MNRVVVVVLKEWSEVFRNRAVLLTLVAVPLLLTAIGLASVVPVVNVPEAQLQGDAAEIAKLAGQTCDGLDARGCLQVWIAGMLRVMYLVIPTALPSVMASYSVVGEKSERTLEPLLATPLRTGELLLAKCLAAVVPAVLATWCSATLYFVVLWSWLDVTIVTRLASPAWMLALFALVPLLAMLSVLVAVVVSSRSVDPRSAQQISSLVVVPVVGMLVAQSLGVAVLSLPIVGGLSVAVALLDLGLGWLAVQVFEREAILTRWTGL